MPIRCIDYIAWSEQSVYVWPARDLIRDAPEYDSNMPLTKADEEAVRNHFARS